MAKMAQKAMAAKKQMSKIKAAGKSGSVGVLIDGLYSVEEVEINREELRKELGNDISERDLDKVIQIFEKNVKSAFNDSKKALEKELANSASIEDLKNLLG